MCERCVELNEQIARIQRICATINDPFAIERFKALIEELEARKAALHPKREP